MTETKMVDISGKAVTSRCAVGFGIITLKPETVEAIVHGNVPKGDVISTAKVAGIMAAKRVPDLIPMCHNIPINVVDLDIRLKSRGIEILSFVKTSYRTGAEIEALTAVNIALITIYDMIKSMDPGATVKSAKVIYKSGGKSGVVNLCAMGGIVFSIAKGGKKTQGGIKTSVDHVECDLHGIVGNGHYGHEYPVTILSLCDLSAMSTEMVKCITSQFNRRYVNLVVTGLDTTGIDPGDVIVFSQDVKMEVISIGKEGAKCRNGWEGAGAIYAIYTRVLKGGTIRVGDRLSLYKKIPYNIEGD